MSEDVLEVIEVIGFDLGHGETSIACAPLLEGAKPEILELEEGKKTQITALGYQDFGYVVGDKALRLPGVRGQRICFKERPPGNKDYPQILQSYMSAYDTQMKAREFIKGGKQSYYFVGCPSGWKDEEIEIYERMLKSENIAHLKVVRESRAALLQAKEACVITDDQLKGSVVVIDVGSSTVDIALVIDGLQDELFDTGFGLGASTIEKLILRRSIERSPRRDDLIAFFDSPENSHLRSFYEIECRKAKEDYWRDEEAQKADGIRLTKIVNIGDGCPLEFIVNSVEMEEIVNQPLPELDGLSWTGSFKKLLVQTKAQLDRRNVVPSAVVVIGGASRMPFVEQLCKEHFRGSAFIRYSQPEETVALGLARWGQIYLNMPSFSGEIEDFCKEEVSKIVSDYKDSFIMPIVEEITNGIIDYVAEPALRKWKAGQIKKLREIDSEIIREAETWLLSGEGQRSVMRALSRILKPISMEINDKTMSICGKYGIPHSSLKLDLSIGPQNSLLGVNVIKPFENGLAIAHVFTMILMVVFTGILKTAAATSGPVGWLFLTVTSLMGLFAGLGWMGDMINDADIPQFVRERVMTESKIKKSIEKLRPKLRENIEGSLIGDQFDGLIHAIAEQIRNELDERANEIKWMIL